MNALPKVSASRILAALAVGLAAGPALAQPAQTPQPPMNDFYQAFYRCDGGGAFSVTYDTDQPAKAELAANDGSKTFELKRATSTSGFEFSAGAAKFWTDGKTVVVEGTKTAFKNCKIKPN